MSVDFFRRYVREMRARGATIIEHDGCYSRGNGQTSDYEGGVWHHTAASYDGGLSVLINGRSGLSGPLTNMAGHANGAGRLIAAHPANHAGASGGRGTAPLPVTRSFNKRVVGLEIMYPGDKPMTREQAWFMRLHGAVVMMLLGRPNADWMRGHAETSITGKWDPGYAPGRTIDLHAARKASAELMGGQLPPPQPAPTTGRRRRTGLLLSA